MRRKGRPSRWPTGIGGQAGAERVEGRRDGEKVEGSTPAGGAAIDARRRAAACEIWHS